jgi:hypothetical protein
MESLTNATNNLKMTNPNALFLKKVLQIKVSTQIDVYIKLYAIWVP